MKALDLFCKAGGAGMGLHQAGFEVTGIDIEPQKNYPFTFLQGDVLKINIERARQFDLIWASPPCQAHSALKVLHNAKKHMDLIPQTRALLKAIGKPYVIENVIGAPLVDPVRLCGTMFGLGVKDADLRRHRIFETSFSVEQLQCNHGARATIGVYGDHIRNRKRTIAPTGHDLVANSTARRLNREAGYPDFTIADGYEAMGINWMVRDELSQAIPPAYSKYLGEQFLRTLERKTT